MGERAESGRTRFRLLDKEQAAERYRSLKEWIASEIKRATGKDEIDWTGLERAVERLGRSGLEFFELIDESGGVRERVVRVRMHRDGRGKIPFKPRENCVAVVEILDANAPRFIIFKRGKGTKNDIILESLSRYAGMRARVTVFPARGEPGSKRGSRVRSIVIPVEVDVPGYGRIPAGSRVVLAAEDMKRGRYFWVGSSHAGEVYDVVHPGGVERRSVTREGIILAKSGIAILVPAGRGETEGRKRDTGEGRTERDDKNLAWRYSRSFLKRVKPERVVSDARGDFTSPDVGETASMIFMHGILRGRNELSGRDFMNVGALSNRLVELLVGVLGGKVGTGVDMVASDRWFGGNGDRLVAVEFKNMTGFSPDLWRAAGALSSGERDKAAGIVGEFVSRELIPRLLEGLPQAAVRYPDEIEGRPVDRCVGVIFPLMVRGKGGKFLFRAVAVMVNPGRAVLKGIEKLVGELSDGKVEFREVRKDIERVMGGGSPGTVAGEIVRKLISLREMFINDILERIEGVRMVPVRIEPPLTREAVVMEDYDEIVEVMRNGAAVAHGLFEASSVLKDASKELIRASSVLKDAMIKAMRAGKGPGIRESGRGDVAGRISGALRRVVDSLGAVREIRERAREALKEIPGNSFEDAMRFQGIVEELKTEAGKVVEAARAVMEVVMEATGNIKSGEDMIEAVGRAMGEVESVVGEVDRETGAVERLNDDVEGMRERYYEAIDEAGRRLAEDLGEDAEVAFEYYELNDMLERVRGLLKGMRKGRT